MGFFNMYRPGMCFLKHCKFKEIVLVPMVSKIYLNFGKCSKGWLMTDIMWMIADEMYIKLLKLNTNFPQYVLKFTKIFEHWPLTRLSVDFGIDRFFEIGKKKCLLTEADLRIDKYIPYIYQNAHLYSFFFNWLANCCGYLMVLLR